MLIEFITHFFFTVPLGFTAISDESDSSLTEQLARKDARAANEIATFTDD